MDKNAGMLVLEMKQTSEPSIKPMTNDKMIPNLDLNKVTQEENQIEIADQFLSNVGMG